MFIRYVPNYWVHPEKLKNERRFNLTVSGRIHCMRPQRKLPASEDVSSFLFAYLLQREKESENKRVEL